MNEKKMPLESEDQALNAESSQLLKLIFLC